MADSFGVRRNPMRFLAIYLFGIPYAKLSMQHIVFGGSREA
jgi:hypothetical protein